MWNHHTSVASAEVCIRRTTTVSVVCLALIAAVVSFGHMHELAVRHGETTLNATLIPLSVDGMVVASSMSVLLVGRAGIGIPWLPWTLLIVGSLASLAANVEVAEPTVVGRVIAAWPSFAFVGAYHLLQGQLRMRLLTQQKQDDPEAGNAEPEPAAGEPEPKGPGADAPEVPDLRKHLQREAWQWALAYRAENGELPGGAAIGRHFKRSPRWGRLVKNAGLAGALPSLTAADNASTYIAL
ncbi:DUF2637 domain-containing protein [Actinoallomurus sp. NPDC052274]|uniref:DUF2637 domain-containing protein n=1 Tax=Actinoallomurus sp. NPDC052274 TaxID=3155420 RepID=UPI00341AA8F8